MSLCDKFYLAMSSSILPVPPSLPELEEPIKEEVKEGVEEEEEKKEQEEEDIFEFDDKPVFDFLEQVYDLLDYSDRWKKDHKNICSLLLTTSYSRSSAGSTVWSRPHPESVKTYFFFASLPQIGYFLMYTLSRIQYITSSLNLSLFHIILSKEWKTIYLSLLNIYLSEVRTDLGIQYTKKIPLYQQVRRMEECFYTIQHRLKFPNLTAEDLKIEPLSKTKEIIYADTFRDLLTSLLIQACFINEKKATTAALMEQCFNMTLFKLNRGNTIEGNLNYLINHGNIIYSSFFIQLASLYYYVENNPKPPKYLSIKIATEIKQLLTLFRSNF